MILYRTPGRSFTRPPRTSTIECSCRLWPTPGMYAVTSMPLESRTRATFRSAEFGFFGVVVYTRVHTPRRWGEPFSAGVLFFDTLSWRPFRTNWLMVGTAWFSFLLGVKLGVLLLRPSPPRPHGQRCGAGGGAPRGRACRPSEVCYGDPLQVAYASTLRTQPRH